ncbi:MULTISPECIES: GNAT family N-acetyltransferase [unclassified Solwaraspora]|uniref:GNAT family N-acetyltransferase n=1 Tax=unclassified Solwaraspora TaxID=2627926 RepID=UPI00259BA353|nr:GNAT family N-acetyltransferase [Solwaraspora sp. WMMA2056]WJK39765.1 GNAT family N-acetyltransferase [Solwaraspora sp. WMMA2056]
MALWRIRATVDDRPGYLAVLTASLALRAVNILAVQVHTTEAGAVDDFLVDAPETLTEADLIAAVERGRGRDPWVARAEARGLADQPTRSLALANRLVRDPEALGDVLRALLGASTVTWRPAPVPEPAARLSDTMRLPDPAGGCYDVVRREPSFTPAEFARAQALVELAAAVNRRTGDQVNLMLADGTELTVRSAVTDDLPALRAMISHCPVSSGTPGLPGRPVATVTARLQRMLEQPRGLLLVAVEGSAAGDQIVGVGQLVVEGALGEVSLLVEPTWRRRGVGTALLRRLAAAAGRAGQLALVAHVAASDLGMLRTLARLHRPGPVEQDGELMSVTVPLVDRPVDVAAPTPAATT